MHETEGQASEKGSAVRPSLCCLQGNFEGTKTNTDSDKTVLILKGKHKIIYLLAMLIELLLGIQLIYEVTGSFLPLAILTLRSHMLVTILVGINRHPFRRGL